MRQPFVGAEAISEGRLTRGQLRWNHTAVHPGVYLPKSAERTLYLSTVAAWLWTGRKGVIAGRAAAALHGAKWVADEISRVGELPVTTPARTALDLARHLPRDVAVAHLDALAAATGVTFENAVALTDKYRGARGIRRARTALALMDAGAQSPEESRLRLMLIDRQGWIDIRVVKEHSRRYIVHRVREAFARRGWIPPK